MNITTTWVAIGLTGQALFFSRSLLQWLASERAKCSVVPKGFWLLSLLGSAFVLSYALYRQDAVFVLGMLPSVVIYTRNMFLRRATSRTRLVPLAIALVGFVIWAAFKKPYVGGLFWALVGFGGSALWMSRFIVQWWTSERQGKAVLPTTFWAMCLAGSLLLLAYAIYRKDPVFIPGFAIGYIVYSRNLYLIHKHRKSQGEPGPATAG